MKHITAALKSFLTTLTVLALVASPIYYFTSTSAYVENYYGQVQSNPQYTQSCYPAVVFEQLHLEKDDSFIDIDFSPAKDQITYLGEMGIIEGTSDNIFSPNKALTRAEYLKMVFLAFGNEVSDDSYENDFSDVSESHWAADLIATAKDLDIINGYVDGSFKPDQQITYVEAIKIASRATGCDFWSSELAEHGVSNQTWSSDWFEGYMAWASDNGIYQLDANTKMVRWNGAMLTYDIMKFVNESLGIEMRVMKHV